MKNYGKAIIGLSAVGVMNALCPTILFARTNWQEHVSSVCEVPATTSCTSVITNPHAVFLRAPVGSIALIVHPVLIAPGFAGLRRQQTRDVFDATSILSAMGLTLNAGYVYEEIVYARAIGPRFASAAPC